MERPDRPRRICIVLLTGLGDVVHGLPVVNALKAHDPQCHITWVVEPMPSAVLSPHPAIDDVVVYEKRRGWRGVRDLRRKLHGRDFDIVLNLNVYFKSIWPTLFAGAPRRVGFDRARAYNGVWLLTNDPLPRAPRAHTQDMFLEFLDHLEVPRGPLRWDIEFTAHERDQQTTFFEQFDGAPVATIVPATANPKKDWFADRFATVADALARDHGFRVLLVGGLGERENRIAAEIAARSSVRPVLALQKDVRRMMWMISGSQLMIAPDTGPLHLARAFGVPVVGLYGHTSPWRVGPYRAYHDLWIDRYTDPGETPDPSRFDARSGRMELITAVDVLERVDRAVRTYLNPP
jgi:heptosyltransferase I